MTKTSAIALLAVSMAALTLGGCTQYYEAGREPVMSTYAPAPQYYQEPVVRRVAPRRAKACPGGIARAPNGACPAIVRNLTPEPELTREPIVAPEPVAAPAKTYYPDPARGGGNGAGGGGGGGGSGGGW